MNKKILYGILLLSLFLLSTASMVRPVYGYSFGVPKAAVGVTGETEVSVYDKDAFKDSLGSGISIKDFKAGDADEVGAKTKSKYLELETDKELIDYEADFIIGPNFEDSHPEIRNLLLSLALNYTQLGGAYGPYGPLGFFANFSTFYAVYFAGLAGADLLVAQAANGVAYNAWQQFIDAIDTYEDFINRWGESYDGSILTRDLWDYTDKAYKEKPNTKKDEVPFLADPRDWYHSYTNLRGYANEIYGELDSIQAYWGKTTGWWATLAGGCAGIGPDFDAYEAVNDTIYQQLNAIPITYMIDVAIPGMGGVLTTMPLRYYLFSIMNVSSDLGELLGPPLPTGVFTYDEDYALGLWGFGDGIVETVRETIKALVPDKFGYLLQQLEEGQPTYVPQADFLARMLKEYDADNDFDGDHVYKIPYLAYGADLNNDGEVSSLPVGSVSPNTGEDLGGETIYIYAEPEVSLDGATITVEINYLDDQTDPKDVLEGETDPNELDDWEWVFAYGDTGTSSETIQSGNTILWQPKGISQIPGFELTIVLGVSAISIIGIIYVIMKKRKM